MKKDFRISAIIMPIVLGILLCIAFFLFIHNSDLLYPIPQGTLLAYHDAKADSQKKTDTDNLKKNDFIGMMECRNTELRILYNADYSSLAGAASLNTNGQLPGEIGCAYIHTYFANFSILKNISDDEEIVISGINGEHKYKYLYSSSSKSEYEIVSKNPDVSKGLVIYCEKTDGIGFSSDYDVYVFEEVQ